jgi:hypothetical protein
MTLSESLRKAIVVWKHTGVELVPPASDDEIRAVIKGIGRRSSAEILQLYQATGGFAGGCDSHVWSLWSLDRIGEVNATYDRPQIAFSDGLIDSFYFCFQYEDELTSSVWIDHGSSTDLIRVTESLAEFFELYLIDPKRIGLV